MTVYERFGKQLTPTFHWAWNNGKDLEYRLLF